MKINLHSYTRSEEDALVRLCNVGDAEAISTLLSRMWSPIYKLALKLSRNEDDAEEITQEALMRAIQKLKNYNPEKPFRVWLWKTAINVFLDRQKRSRTAVKKSRRLAWSLSQSTPSVEEEVERLEYIEHLRDEINFLPKEQQSILRLRAMDLDYKQIADNLKITESTVRWHVHEARKTLYDKLEVL